MNINEHKIAVLIKAALDSACELDCIKNIAPVCAEERERISQIVERIYAACEEVQGE